MSLYLDRPVRLKAEVRAELIAKIKNAKDQLATAGASQVRRRQEDAIVRLRAQLAALGDE